MSYASKVGKPAASASADAVPKENDGSPPPPPPPPFLPSSSSSFSALDDPAAYRRLADAFHRDGFVVVENAISSQMRTDLLSDLRAAQSTERRRSKDRFTHQMYTCFFTQSPATVRLVAQSGLADFGQFLIADGVPGARVGGNSLTAHLIHNNAFSVPPGGRGQAPSWHTDDAMQNVALPVGYVLPPEVKLPVMVLTCMVWLSDCDTPDKGPTFVVPGSHRFGHAVDPVYAERHAVPACGKAGSVVFLNNQTWHRGAKNSSAVARDTLQVTFGRRIISHMFGSIMNYHLPETVTRNMDEKTRERFGFLQGGAYS